MAPFMSKEHHDVRVLPWLNVRPINISHLCCTDMWQVLKRIGATVQSSGSGYLLKWMKPDGTEGITSSHQVSVCQPIFTEWETHILSRYRVVRWIGDVLKCKSLSSSIYMFSFLFRRIHKDIEDKFGWTEDTFRIEGHMYPEDEEDA